MFLLYRCHMLRAHAHPWRPLLANAGVASFSRSDLTINVPVTTRCNPLIIRYVSLRRRARGDGYVYV